MTALIDAPLGKIQDYPTHYDSSLLFPIARLPKRLVLQINAPLPFQGVDIWNAYEISWLNAKGKPMIALLRMVVACESLNIIESKSLKLYFNSLNQCNFKNPEQIRALISQDLKQVLRGEVEIQLFLKPESEKIKSASFAGLCLDDLDVTCDTYELKPEFLSVDAENVEETLHSHLFKSNCPVTNQPDWASLLIKYKGPQINHTGLLKYIVSFRNHAEFHEQCVERIFVDIMRYCQPEGLTVYANYTRRGGIDINPFRSNFEMMPALGRLVRQ